MMRDLKKVKKARKELRRMLRALGNKDQLDAYFAVGAFKARKKLGDGSIVHFSVTEPGHNRREPRRRG
jgi:hypothetical protein